MGIVVPPKPCRTRKQRRLEALLAAAFLALAITGCTKKDESSVAVPPVDQKPTNEDFEAYLKVKRVAADSTEQRDQAKKVFFKRDALAMAITKEPLLDQALIEAELRDFRNELLIKRYFDAFLKESVSEEALESNYQANKTNYMRRKVNVAHMLFRTDAAMSEAQKSAKLAKVKRVRAKLAQGASFTELVQQFSEDPVTAKKEGKLGWIAEGVGDRNFFKAAFVLKKGEVSEPVEGQLGFHIIRALENPVEEQLPFAQVKRIVENKLRYEAKQAEIKRLLGNVETESVK